MTFATAVPILFTSFVYRTNLYWSVINGIQRKPHLSVVWNWYHFVAIAILHQPRPTDSADMNTRLQLSGTSSIPPMHGGFLLISQPLVPYCVKKYKDHMGPALGHLMSSLEIIQYIQLPNLVKIYSEWLMNKGKSFNEKWELLFVV